MTIQILEACSYNDRNDKGFYRVEADDVEFCKKFYNGQEYSANAVKKYKVGDFYDPWSLEELYPILTELENDSKKLVVRYKTDRKRNETILRRAEIFEPDKSHIIAIDVDSVILPPHISPVDILGQGTYVCNLLHKCDPETFPDDMGFIAQGSAKAGLHKNIRLHLWLENHSKVTQGQLRNVFTQINKIYSKEFEPDVELVDTALYHTVQIHYTAAPLFSPRTDDPFFNESRTVMSFGNRCYIPDTVASFSANVKASEEEIIEYLKQIDGSIEPSENLLKKFSVISEWDITDRGLRTKVISLYHEAVQETFSLEVLDKWVFDILKYKRPGQEQDYINQAKNAAVIAIKSNSIRSIPKEYERLPINKIESGTLPRYLDINQSKFPEDGIVFLKASLGTGKTYTIERWLESGRLKGKFLSITDTSALVEANAARFKAGDFRSAKARLDFATGDIDRLSGTLHSLYKIKDFARDFDVLFIDEADSVLNNLLFAKIINDELKYQIRDVLYDLLISTKLVILSDGDISEETVARYIELVDGDRDFYGISHIRPALKGVTAYKHPKESSIWGALQGALEVGHKCLVVTDQGPDVLNTMKIALKRVCPFKNIEVAHANSKMDSKVASIINETNNALLRHNVDALLCSPSITNGVDFDYFDTTFVITKTSNHTPNMRFQALMRERHPKEIHYYFDNIKGYVTGYKDSPVEQGWFDLSRCALAIRREKEFRSYTGTFNYYLVNAGCKIEAIREPLVSPKCVEDEQQYNLERIDAVFHSKPDVFIPRHNDAYEVKCLCAFMYDTPIDELAYDQVANFIATRPDKAAENLHEIFITFWDVIKKASPYALMEALQSRGKLYYNATGKQARPSMANAKRILKFLNIETIDDIPMIVDMYIKYCTYHGYEIPEELQGETNREII